MGGEFSSEGHPGMIPVEFLRALSMLSFSRPEVRWRELARGKQTEADLAKIVLDQTELPAVSQRAADVFFCHFRRLLPYKTNVVPSDSSSEHEQLVAQMATNTPDKLIPALQRSWETISAVSKNRQSDQAETTSGAISRFQSDVSIAMEHVPTDKLNSLVDLFPLNDPVPYEGPDESSGYNPFAHLLYDPGIPTQAKMGLIEKMHGVILSEISGTTYPRVPHESAPVRYVDELIIMTHSKEPPIPQDVFDQEALWVATHCSNQIASTDYLSRNIPLLINIIHDPDIKAQVTGLLPKTI